MKTGGWGDGVKDISVDLREGTAYEGEVVLGEGRKHGTLYWHICKSKFLEEQWEWEKKGSCGKNNATIVAQEGKGEGKIFGSVGMNIKKRH